MKCIVTIVCYRLDGGRGVPPDEKVCPRDPQTFDSQSPEFQGAENI